MATMARTATRNAISLPLLPSSLPLFPVGCGCVLVMASLLLEAVGNAPAAPRREAIGFRYLAAAACGISRRPRIGPARGGTRDRLLGEGLSYQRFARAEMPL